MSPITALILSIAGIAAGGLAIKAVEAADKAASNTTIKHQHSFQLRDEERVRARRAARAGRSHEVEVGGVPLATLLRSR